MRCMVKIDDLEERVEPPLCGMMGASTSISFKGDAMDMEESVGLQEGTHLVAHLSPKDVQGETS
jgi:predicted heme/steroid binding protein